MISLIKIIDEMKNDYQKDLYREVKVLTRKITLSSKCEININLYKNDNTCEVSVMLPEDTTAESLKSLPRWKGMEEYWATSLENETKNKYLEFKQLSSYDQRIFIQVMQDVINSVESSNIEKTVQAIKEALSKWSAFFKRNDEMLLSAVEQQGLYGELYVLNKLLSINSDAVHWWTGSNKETHDFYFDDNALEVKTSSKVGPDKVMISNEYQLDDFGVGGNLHLMFIKLKKSDADGERLSQIVDRICEKISESDKAIFEEKLLKACYLYDMPELYTYCFRVRDERCYIVENGFPRIIATNTNDGIGSVKYELSLDACSAYEISVESFYEGVIA